MEYFYQEIAWQALKDFANWTFFFAAYTALFFVILFTVRIAGFGVELLVAWNRYFRDYFRD
jgi:hypothetical protein